MLNLGGLALKDIAFVIRDSAYVLHRPVVELGDHDLVVLAKWEGEVEKPRVKLNPHHHCVEVLFRFEVRRYVFTTVCSHLWKLLSLRTY